MACYYRKLRKGIYWYYKFDFNNRTYFSKCIYPTKKDAQKAERERHDALEEERLNGRSKPIYFKEAIIERINFLKIKYSVKHAEDSEYYLNLAQSFIGNKDIKTISKKDINDFLLDYAEQLKSSDKDNYQVNACIKTLKSMYNYIIDRYDLTIRNPAKGIKPFSVKKKLKYIPTDVEIDRVFECFNHRQKLLFNFVKETGCRINEALNLTFDDIKNDYLILYTRKSANSDRVPRKVPIPFCINNLEGVGRVFYEWTETPKFLDKALRENEWKIWGWHCLRHRYASRLLKEGRNIFEIMTLLGHSNLKTTQRYLQLLE